MNDSGWLLKRSYWLTAVLSAGTVLIAACGPPPAGLQLGADQDGSNSGGAAAGTGAGAGELPEELGAVASIDHFEDGDDIILPLGGRQGRWYAFGDGTGTMTPSSGADFVPATGGPDDS